MDSKLPRILGAFAVFFTLTLPLFAALIAAAVYAPLVNIATKTVATNGGLADFFLNHFRVALVVPIVIGVAGAAAAFLARRVKGADPVHTLGRLLVIQTLVCFLTFLWFAAYIVAALKS